MKLSCDIYEDLLLLYEDGLCSEDTKKLVEEHLAECERCSSYLKKMQLPEEMIQEGPTQEESEEDALAERESIRKSFRKIRRRWAMSLLIIPLLLLLSGPVFMIVNEVRGDGICFSNLDDIWRCHRFWSLISHGDYDKAVKMLDYTNSYYNVRATLLGETYDGQTEEIRQFYYEVYGDVLNMTLDEFNHQEQQKVADWLRENEPVMLRDYRYYRAYRYSDNSWNIGYRLAEGIKHSDIVGKEDVKYSISFQVTANGLTSGGSTGLDHYLRGDSGVYVLDEEGNLIETWIPEEELVFFNAFHISSDEVCKKIYTWHQSKEQQSTGN